MTGVSHRFPTRVIVPSYSGEVIVEVAYGGREQNHRSVISTDSSDRYHVHLESWDTSEWGARRLAYWCGNQGVLAKSLEDARASAAVTLAQVVGEELDI